MRSNRFMLIVTIVPALAFAYGQDTHQVLSNLAVNKSILVTGSILQDWGVSIGTTFPSAAQANQSPPADPQSYQSISNLISQVGARDEDEGSRPANHFYDPIANTALTACLANNFVASSPDWAVLGKNQGASGGYSFASARQAMLNAFISRKETDREAGFGMLFESLGHVIHHVQDMAQPQHVRNDAHLERENNLSYLVGSNPSRYEAATDDDISFGRIKLSTTYPAATFAAPTDYWANAQGSGLAQFTNANFVSQGTNFQYRGDYLPNDKYRLPAPIGVAYDDIQNVLAGNQTCPGDATCSLRGGVTFIRSYVTDNYPGGKSGPNDRAAMLSIFDQDLKKAGILSVTWSLCGQQSVSSGQLFTVNRLTFPSAQSFLIPAAIGYSAGMINYILRGKIDVVPHRPKGVWDGTYELKNLGNEAISGQFQLYYDTANGSRFSVVGPGWPMSVTLAAAVPPDPNDPDPANSPDRKVIPQISDQLPSPASPGIYVAVFNGTMGSEVPIGSGPGAVVAKQVNLSSPQIYWSYNAYYYHTDPSGVTPPGWYGSAMVNFITSPAMDTFYGTRTAYASTHVKINDQDAPQAAWDPVVGTSSCSPPAGPLAYEGLVGGVPDHTQGWGWMYSTQDNVAFDDPTGHFANGFLLGKAEDSPNVNLNWPAAFPACAIQLQLTWLNPQQNIKVELFEGTQSMFAFCIRLVPGYVDPTLQRGTAQAFVSHLRGAQMVNAGTSAIGVVEDLVPQSCPGYQ